MQKKAGKSMFLLTLAGLLMASTGTNAWAEGAALQSVHSSNEQADQVQQADASTDQTAVEAGQGEPESSPDDGVPNSDVESGIGNELSADPIALADDAADIPEEVMQKAEKLGKSVVGEAVDRRTANSKSYQLSDGSYVAVISLEDQNYQDSAGQWRAIQTDLSDEADVDAVSVQVSKESFKSIKQLSDKNRAARKDKKLDRSKTHFRALQVPFDADIPKNYSEGYSIGKGANKLTFIPQAASSVTGAVYGKDAVMYKGVWASTDVTLAVENDGIKESILLKDAAAPSQFSFEVKGTLAKNLRAGDLAVKPAWLKDANGVERDVAQSLRTEGDKTFLDVKADVSDLAYPILIDPTVGTLNAAADTYISDAGSTVNHDTDTELVDGNGAPTFYFAFLKFDLSTYNSSWKLLDASLVLHGSTASSWGGSSSGANMTVTRMISDWSSSAITYSNFSPATNKWTDDGNKPLLMSGVASISTVTFDITQTLNKWVTNQAPNYGIGIKNATASGYISSAVYFRFYSKEYSDATKRPAILVNYVEDSGTPTVITPNGGEKWDGVNPITWNIPDITTVPLDVGYSGTLNSSLTVNSSLHTTKVAQTFTTLSYASLLQSITWRLQSSGTTCRISIYATNGTLPTNEIWGANITIPAGTEYTQSNIGLLLQPNTRYAFVISQVSQNLPIAYNVNNTMYSGKGEIYTYTSSWTYTSGSMGAKFGFNVGPLSELKHQIQLSTNNGQTWSDIVPLTSPGVSSYSYDFSAVPETTQAKIRVRSYNGYSYSAWDESNYPFIIKHNAAPTAPTALKPGSSQAAPEIAASPTPILNWTFNDPNAADTQSQYEVMIYDGSTAVLDSGWVPGSTGSFTVPSGVLTRGKSYSWKVRTKDNSEAISPYSALTYIKINTLPTLALTSYSDGQQINDNVLTFSWTYNDSDGQLQTDYQVLGSQDNWASIGYDSGMIHSADHTFTTGALSRGTWNFKVLAKDGLEWSVAALRSNLTLSGDYEPNDSKEQAFTAGYNQVYTSLIGSASDVDFFKYTAASNGFDLIHLTVPSGINYDVYVYDSNLKLVAAGVRDAGEAEDMLYAVATGKTYYIKIVGVGGSYSTTNSYSLKLTKLAMRTQTTYTYDVNGNLIHKTTAPTE